MYQCPGFQLYHVSMDLSQIVLGRVCEYGVQYQGGAHGSHASVADFVAVGDAVEQLFLLVWNQELCRLFKEGTGAVCSTLQCHSGGWSWS